MSQSSSSSAVEVVRQFHEGLWGAGDLAIIDTLVAPDATVRMTGFEGRAVDVVREDASRYLGAFDQVVTSIDELVADGDRVVSRWHTHGRHVGPYGTIAPEPTGRVITMEGVDFYRVAEGRIVDVWSFWDAAAVYRQFGLLRDDL